MLSLWIKSDTRNQENLPRSVLTLNAKFLFFFSFSPCFRDINDMTIKDTLANANEDHQSSKREHPAFFIIHFLGIKRRKGYKFQEVFVTEFSMKERNLSAYICGLTAEIVFYFPSRIQKLLKIFLHSIFGFTLFCVKLFKKCSVFFA